MSLGFTEHALEACARRGIDPTVDRLVVEDPEQRERQGHRWVHQRVMDMPPDGAPFLVRVVIEPDGELTLIVTAYRTTKFEKYGATR